VAEDLPLSPEDVEEIISILSKSDYATLDIGTARFSLRVARDCEGWTQEWRPAGGEARPTDGPAQANTRTSDDGLLVITAPLPGTFYRAPQPGAPPFVEVGDKVSPDTVVAIIETMKLMNPVHAGVDGDIAEIIPENAEPIESHSILMKVKPA
jgi:acetyl-CoA carboxylase biotin carboxyl carrier protein